MLVKKASGEMEKFQPNKIRVTLLRAGASRKLADEIVETVSKKIHEGMTTDEIMDIACKLLAENDPCSACRYGLKKAIMRLGPTGYPFETFVGELLKKHGYKVKLRQYARGLCAKHEIDVVATKPSVDREKRSMIECKYRNTGGQYIELKEILITYARFLDLVEGWEKGKGKRFDEAWLISNAKASQAAKKYAKCREMKLICWNYPVNGSLRDIIEQKNLYPITVLRTVDEDAMGRFSDLGIMFLRDLSSKDMGEMKQATGLSDDKIERIFREAKMILGKKSSNS
ncbi:MAG: ATP cone domain-containing protein [Promethearchaeota archaeon]